MNTLEKIEGSLKKLNYVGNLANAKLLYLASLTRYKKNPVSILIKGSSGSGKSKLMNTILNFIPDEDKVVFTGMSEKSLAFMDKDSVKNKVLAIQEFSGLNNPSGNTILRSLLSEGKITRQTSIADPKDNKFKTQVSEVEGPLALFMTTTEDHIHPEDENRMISMTVDQSDKQKREILLAKANSFNKTIDEKNINEEVKKISHEYKANLKNVSIPFATSLAENMDIKTDQILRYFDQILTLIEAHALLNQSNRKINNQGSVIANEEDYIAVSSLLEPTFRKYNQNGLDPDILRIIEVIKENGEIKGSFLDASPNDYDKLNTSNKHLSKILNMPESTFSEKCKKAKKLGLIENAQPSGKPAEYIILKDLSSIDKVLPDWRQLS